MGEPEQAEASVSDRDDTDALECVEEQHEDGMHLDVIALITE